jgi:hypothetical protein
VYCFTVGMKQDQKLGPKTNFPMSQQSDDDNEASMVDADNISEEPLVDCEERAERRARASGIVVKEELDRKGPLLELWQQNQRTREPNLR